MYDMDDLNKEIKRLQGVIKRNNVKVSAALFALIVSVAACLMGGLILGLILGKVIKVLYIGGFLAILPISKYGHEISEANSEIKNAQEQISECNMQITDLEEAIRKEAAKKREKAITKASTKAYAYDATHEKSKAALEFEEAIKKLQSGEFYGDDSYPTKDYGSKRK